MERPVLYRHDRRLNQKGKIKRTGLDKSITVAPQGHNKRGTRNAEVAFVNEFGKRGQPGRPALKTANERKNKKPLRRARKSITPTWTAKNFNSQ